MSVISEAKDTHLCLATVKTILIVDDSRTDREIYKNWLSRLPKSHYKFIEASNVKEGCEVFYSARPDCIILDFQMKEQNGFEMLSTLRDSNANIPPVIFVTGMSSDVVGADAISNGVYIYMNKNRITKERLIEALRNALKTQN